MIGRPDRKLRLSAVRTLIRGRNRIVGLDRYADPLSYYGPGGIDEAAEQCLVANRDLLGFLRPPARIDPSNAVAGARFRRGNVDVEPWTFDSPFPSGDPDNDRVHLRIYRKAGAAPDSRVLLFHHATYQKRYALWEWFLAPLIEHMPVALLAAPYHFERTGRARFPGEGSMNPNPYRLYEALRQWCHDRQAAVSLLEGPAGLRVVADGGYSLGGFQTLLLAAAGRVPGPIVTISATNRYAWGLHNGIMAYNLKRSMGKLGLGFERLREMTYALEAERHVEVLRGHPILYVYSGHDHVDPHPSLERLADALQPTRKLHFPLSGHATLALQRQHIMPEVVDFIARPHQDSSLSATRATISEPRVRNSP